MKTTDDTDDGYDECQTSDEYSDIDCNNVVRLTQQSSKEFKL